MKKYDSTIIQLLSNKVKANPEKVLYTFLKNGITETERRTYQQLHDMSSSIGAVLHKHAQVGDRVLLLFPSGLSYIDAFFGALYAGIIAVTAYPPTLNSKNEKLKSIINDCKPKIVLTTSEMYKKREDIISNIPSLSEVLWICSEEIANADGSDWFEPTITSDSIAFLQYTSGSTSNPKGVMVSHKNLLCNEALLSDGFSHNENSNYVTWLPIYHDMGLIGNIIQSLYSGSSCFLMSPFSFLKKPIVWLEAISKYRAHTSGGPNFAYDLLSRTVTEADLVGLDLSCWKIAFNGAEPIRSSTVKSFSKKFKSVGFENKAFYPCYGLAEATLFVTGSEKNLPCEIISVDGKNMVSSGFVRQEFQEVLIVDPDTKNECSLGTIGEIWVSGDSVALGYWNNPEKTDEIFNAFTCNSKKGPFLRTGDMGFFGGDELYVSGRLKELIIIKGRNFYPQDIELIVEGCDSVLKPGCSASFSIDHNNEEKLIVVQEIKNRVKINNIQQLLGKINLEISRNLEVDVYDILLVKSGSIPKTTSGKIQRIKAKKLYLGNQFDVIGYLSDCKKRIIDNPDRVDYIAPKSDIEKLLIDICQQSLGIDKVGTSDSFFELGATSLTLSAVSNELNKRLNRSISQVAFYTYTNIKSLAEYLSIDKIEVTESLEIEESKNCDIAIIGMNGRFPGAENISIFWENLKEGIDSISHYSEEELYDLGFSEKDIENPNYVKSYGSVHGKEYFDAEFFGYSSKDAEFVNPQTRLLLESVWSALEDGGYNPESYKGSIGMFAGGNPNMSWFLSSYFSKNEMSDIEVVQLSEPSYMSTRVSYNLNLKGPSYYTYSACSTAMVNMVIACDNLNNRTCDMALAGGVTAESESKTGYMYSEGSIFSSDGHCRPFSIDAGGTVFGEGSGILLLKRLEDAIRDNDNIHAVIKGYGTNNDGNKKAGYTAPSVIGQADLIRSVQKKAGVTPETITYIEAHGTGTKMGDPIEIEALKMAFNTEKRQYCGIGSVKSNIGHLVCAAGAAGVIKTILSLKNKQIPPSIHVDKENPLLNIEDSPFYINKKLKEWKTDGIPLRAGVSSYGIGGTNAHMILEEAPAIEKGYQDKKHEIINMSALSESALNKNIRNLLSFLKNNRELNLSDISYTLNVGRKCFENRYSVAVSSVDNLIDKLENEIKFPLDSVRNNVNIKQTIAFMFPGQGSQYSKMGYDLYEGEKVFREAVDECFKILKKLRDIDFKDVIYGNDDIDGSHVSSCSMFIIEYGMTMLLKSRGINPDILIGHSLGEYTAACISGVLSLEDTLTLVYDRGLLIQRLSSGAMLSVFIEKEELLSLLDDTISLAVENSDSLYAVSGSVESISKFKIKLDSGGYGYKELKVTHAFHSYMLEPILDDFRATLNKLTFNKSNIPYVSNVTGELITYDEVKSVEYWVDHFRGTVKFNGGLKYLLQDENTILLEVGPGTSLTSLVNINADKLEKHIAVNTLRHAMEEVSDELFFNNSLSSIWVYGGEIDWEEYYSHENRRRISLPTYAFDKVYYGKLFNKMLDKSKFDRVLGGAESSSKHITYLPSWKRKEIPKNDNKKQYKYLLFMDDKGVTDKLRDKIVKLGNKVITVKPGDEYSNINDKEYFIDPNNSGHYMKLFQELKSNDNIPEVIIHSWSLSDPENKEVTIESVNIAKKYGFYSAFYITKSLGNLDIVKDIKIYFISNEIYEVFGHENISPAQSLLSAATKVITKEYSNIKCCNLDLTSIDAIESSYKLIDQLCNEIYHPITEFQVAFRQNNRWILNYEEIDLDNNFGKSRLKEKGVYIILGGLGGIGLTFGKSLSDDYCARLALTTRSEFPNRSDWELIASGEIESRHKAKILKLLEIETSGSEVIVYKADISNKADMERLVTSVVEKWGSIDGVIHAAGLADGKIIKLREKSDIDDVLKSKIDGTIVLMDVLSKYNLDFVLLCSSIASVTGKFGQFAYTAANQFLDSFAASYKSKGLDVISINWPGWKDVGMFADSKYFTDEEKREECINPSVGSEILNRVLEADFPNIIVSKYEVNSLIEMHKVFNVEDQVGNTVSSRPDLDTEYIPPTNDTEEILVGIWQNILGLEKVGISDNYSLLGGNSLKSISFISKCYKSLGVKLTLENLYKLPTVKELALYINDIKSVTRECIEDEDYQVIKI